MVILIASGKGGTGKTSISANIGTALAAMGKLTVLVDMDMGLRNLDIMLGLESNIVYDICDVIDNTCTIDEALINGGENLYFLSSPQTRNDIEFGEEQFLSVWETLNNRFEYCIIDAPAGVGDAFIYSLAGADMVMIVAVPEISSLRDADRVISVAENRGAKDIRLIINRIRPELIEKGIMMNVDDCADMLGVPIAGLVPEDYIPMSLNPALAVNDEKSGAGCALKNISRRITGEEVPVMEFKDKQGFFEKLKRAFMGN